LVPQEDCGLAAEFPVPSVVPVRIVPAWLFLPHRLV